MARPRHKNNSVRWCVISFSFIIAIMLYQPSDNSGMGTVLALVTMLTTAFLFLIQNNQRNIRIREESFLLVAFTAFVAISTLIQTPRFYNNIEKMAAQALLTALLCAYTLREREEIYLKKIFEFTVIINSIFIIIYCVTIRNAAYFHSSIVIFGSVLDPNYIGLPLIPGSMLLLYDIFKHKKIISKFLFFIAFIIVFVAIIQTSSRGNFLAFSIGNGLVYINYNMKGPSFSYKLRAIFFILLITLMFNEFLFPLFSDNVNRMIDFGEDSNNGRFELWGKSIEVWKKNLLFGGGIGSVYLYAHKGSHSLFLQLLAETGIVGSFLFCRFLYLSFRHAISHDKLYGYIILTLIIQVAFLTTLENRCFWVILGWISLLPLRKTRKNSALYYNERLRNNQIIKKVDKI